MTESEWLASPDPDQLFSFLGGKLTMRKRRLFACACCRRVWPLLTDERSRAAVALAERYADEQVIMDLSAKSELRAVAGAAERAYAAATDAGAKCACIAANTTLHNHYHYWAAAEPATWAARAATGDARGDAGSQALAAERRAQCALFREICNPFWFRVSAAPSWLACREGTVTKMASAIYENQAYEQLPILADALEESSCDDTQLLEHLRGPAPHVKGCWAVDLLLGKR